MSEADSSWSVYIVRCADDSLYTGIAKDVEKRLIAHHAGKGAKYTKTRLPLELEYTETGYSRSTALKREHVIKALSRAEKLALIGG